MCNVTSTLFVCVIYVIVTYILLLPLWYTHTHSLYVVRKRGYIRLANIKHHASNYQGVGGLYNNNITWVGKWYMFLYLGMSVRRNDRNIPQSFPMSMRSQKLCPSIRMTWAEWPGSLVFTPIGNLLWRLQDMANTLYYMVGSGNTLTCILNKVIFQRLLHVHQIIHKVYIKLSHHALQVNQTTITLHFDIVVCYEAYWLPKSTTTNLSLFVDSYYTMKHVVWDISSQCQYKNNPCN